VLGGPTKVHSDAVLPIRQPKGPDIAKNFATRIRRKAVNKLYAAAAERRSKSAADRRKSAMF
ncbi:7869_t:CDS:1, partial [Racocetra persica]